MKREKEPMSMEEYANRITDKLAIEYYFIDNKTLGSIIFDAIQRFQDLQDEKAINIKEQYQLEKLEKERQEGK